MPSDLRKAWLKKLGDELLSEGILHAKKGNNNIIISGPSLTAAGFAAAAMARVTHQPVLAITPDEDSSEVIYDAFRYFAGEAQSYHYCR